MADRDPGALRAVSRSLPHDSAEGHVSGLARYTDDVPEPADLLHCAFGQSRFAHARLRSIDLAPVRAAPGVIAVFAAGDIPGKNDVSPVAGDDRLFAEDEVICVGQSLFVVAATSATAARRAARLAIADYEPLPYAVTIAEAQAAGALIEASQRMARGDVATALAAAPHRLAGSLEIGGQDH
ncbi:MAG: xanthine dehydrogenase molybdopterin binding subunit, partial [Sphingomonadaceae bacterium]|nr:xanthine dehydrogenase molybdopterin binding subunit [Sphingomonadaceae bacterium]